MPSEKMTSREFHEGQMKRGLSNYNRAENRARNEKAKSLLKPRLNAGDRIRATKAECCAKEATFTFSHWEGNWIVSISELSIAPASVYSINGEILDF